MVREFAEEVLNLLAMSADKQAATLQHVSHVLGEASIIRRSDRRKKKLRKERKIRKIDKKRKNRKVVISASSCPSLFFVISSSQMNFFFVLQIVCGRPPQHGQRMGRDRGVSLP